LLAPLLIAVPVLIGLVTMIGRALTAGHPDLDFATAVNGDAEAFYLGETIYRDPDEGFTGQLYTPLFPFLVSLLHRVHLWASWPLLVNYAATLGLIALTAYLAWDRGTQGVRRVLALLGAVGMGAFAWWLVSALPVNLLFEGRSDHTAWALAFLGLVVLAWRSHGSTAALVFAGLLLTAAFWAKQTTAVVAAAATLWFLGAAMLGAGRARPALAFAAGLLAANLAVLGLLNLATDGWEWYFDFELATEHPNFATYGESLREVQHLAGGALAVPAVLAVGLAWVGTRSRDRDGPQLRPAQLLRAAGDGLGASRDARIASALLLFVVIGIPAATYFRLKVGSLSNQYLGVLWAAGLLSAIAWRRSLARPATALLACAVIVVPFLFAQRSGDTVRGYRVAPLHLTQEYPEVPDPLLRYARSHLVWEQVQSDLNVETQRSLYPNFYNFVDLLAAGRQPGYLVDALVERRFDAVAPLRFQAGAVRLFWDIYASGVGESEENYIWKLNQVIRSGYEPSPGVPEGFLARRPGPPRDPWIGDCFGPFDLAGAELRIRRGGGLWCREGGDVLALRRTPARTSELVADHTVAEVGGRMELTLPRDGSEVALALTAANGASWRLQVRRSGRLLALDLAVNGRSVATATAPSPAGRRVLTVDRSEEAALRSGVDGSLLVRVPDVGEGELTITATRDSGVRLGMAELEIAR